MQLESLIQWYMDGERATADVLNRPIRTIVDYLDKPSKSMMIEIFDENLIDTNVTPGDYIYVDQTDSKYKKALSDGTQKQNVIGAYSFIDDRHFIIYMGVVNGTYEPGRTYYLSGVTPGKPVIDPSSNEIVLGIAVSPTELILNFSGNTKVVYYALPQLVRPTIVSQVSGQVVTYLIETPPTGVQSYTWNISGTDYTIISGNETGSTSNTLAISANAEGTLNVSVKAEGDNTTYVDSQTSLINTNNIIIADYNISLINSETSNGVTYTDPGPIPTGTLYFNSVDYDNSIPADYMYYTANGRKSKIDFAIEYTGNTFEVELDGVYYTGTFAENEDSSNPTVLTQLGLITLSTPEITSVVNGNNVTYTITVSDTNTESFTWDISGVAYTVVTGNEIGTTNNSITVNVPGSGIIEAKVKAIGDDSSYSSSVYSSSTSDSVGFAVVVGDFDTSITNGESEQGVTITDPGAAPISTLYYNKVSYNSSVPTNFMYISANGRKSKVDYAIEYTNAEFELELDGTYYVGTFTENEDSSNATVLVVK